MRTWKARPRGDPVPEYEDRAARKPWEEGHTCTPLDCFRAFFTLEMEDLILEAMKLYPDVAIGRGRPPWWPRGNQWPPATLDGKISREDLRKTMAIMIEAGVRKTGNMDKAYNGDREAQVPTFKDKMSYRHFKRVLRGLHCTPSAETTARVQNNFDDWHPPACVAQEKTWTFMELFRKQCLTVMCPGKELSLDEATAAYNGNMCKMKFIQKHKPSNGMKVYCACTSTGPERPAGYLANFAWVGHADGSDKLSVSQYVLRVLSPLRGNFHHVYFDNLFTSFKLLKHLKEEFQIYACGTLRGGQGRLSQAHRDAGADARGMPLQWKSNESMKEWAKKPKGTIETRWDEATGITVYYHVDTKPYKLMSSIHGHARGIMQRRKRSAAGTQRHEAPVASLHYNDRMGGVDLFDQFRERRSTYIRSKKWWRVMFAFVLDSAMSNAYLLYCELWGRPGQTRRGNKKDRTDFHCALVRGLCEGAGAEKTITFRARRGRGRPRAPDMPSLPTQPSNEVRMRRGKRQGDRPLPEHRCRVQAVRKGDVWRHCMRCRWYKDAKRTGIVRKTKAFCASCGVPLCENCFEYWHGGEWMPEGWQSCHGSHSADPGIPVART